MNCGSLKRIKQKKIFLDDDDYHKGNNIFGVNLFGRNLSTFRK